MKNANSSLLFSQIFMEKVTTFLKVVIDEEKYTVEFTVGGTHPLEGHSVFLSGRYSKFKGFYSSMAKMLEVRWGPVQGSPVTEDTVLFAGVEGIQDVAFDPYFNIREVQGFYALDCGGGIEINKDKDMLNFFGLVTLEEFIVFADSKDAAGGLLGQYLPKSIVASMRISESQNARMHTFVPFEHNQGEANVRM
jgi:hypothetical protein